MEPELLEVGEVQDGTRYASEHARREVARLEVDRRGAVLPGLPAASDPHDPLRRGPLPPEADGVLRRHQDAAVPARD